jgi:hypothetical protein
MRSVVGCCAAFLIVAGIANTVALALDESPADEAIKEALTILEARKVKATDKAEQEKLSKAISSLEKLVAGQPADEPEATFEIKPEMVKKAFAGKPSFNPKTRVLTFVYDFKSKAQLADFELNDAKPQPKDAALTLQAGEVFRHIVKFKTLTLNTKVIGKPGSLYIKITNSANFWTGKEKDGPIALAILDKNGKPTEDIFERKLPGGTLWPVEITVTTKRLGLKVGDIQLGKANENTTAGYVELHGGSKGNTFQGLVFEGTLDEEWAKEFFAEKKKE